MLRVVFLALPSSDSCLCLSGSHYSHSRCPFHPTNRPSPLHQSKLHPLQSVARRITLLLLLLPTFCAYISNSFPPFPSLPARLPLCKRFFDNIHSVTRSSVATRPTSRLDISRLFRFEQRPKSPAARFYIPTTCLPSTTYTTINHHLPPRSFLSLCIAFGPLRQQQQTASPALASPGAFIN